VADRSTELPNFKISRKVIEHLSEENEAPMPRLAGTGANRTLASFALAEFVSRARKLRIKLAQWQTIDRIPLRQRADEGFSLHA
jgi:hypothetical protein